MNLRSRVAAITCVGVCLVGVVFQSRGADKPSGDLPRDLVPRSKNLERTDLFSNHLFLDRNNESVRFRQQVAPRTRPAPDWVRVAEHAAWQARDSQAEVVFNDRLWMMGGWFDSFKPAPRDVWSSADGSNWEQITAEAPWKHSDLGMASTFAG